MSCSSCSQEFGFLKKEVGCEMCGFSFCSRCCKKREVPTENGEFKKRLTCNKCHEAGQKATTGRTSPPLAHKKRMAALKKQSFSVDSSFKREWSDERDKEIAERLQKLKRERMKDDLPSEEQIEERLAKLKDMDPSKYKAPPIQVFRPEKKRTSVEQATDLMNQLREEVELESKLVKPEDEIAARLAHLRDETLPQKSKELKEVDLSELKEGESEEMDIEKTAAVLQKESAILSAVSSKEIRNIANDPEYKKLLSNIPKKAEIQDEEDQDEEEANKLVEKLMATEISDEVDELESMNGQDTEKSNSKSEEEEFPWCIICTEDAKIRCFGCDGDLYCMRCFKECHDSLDIKDHRTCPFLPTKNPLL